jgi:hypothetical protein
MSLTHYEITVDGYLPDEGLDELQGLMVRHRRGTTVLDGLAEDQQALVGAVERIEARGGRVRGFNVAGYPARTVAEE